MGCCLSSDNDSSSLSRDTRQDICCDEMQDWCRDVCGCCPCMCCKKIDAELQIQQVKQKFKKTDKPFGHALLHPGVRTEGNKYTSPILEVHTWDKLIGQTTVGEEVVRYNNIKRRQSERDAANRHLEYFFAAEQKRLELIEQVTAIPVESIISITSTSELKKREIEAAALIPIAEQPRKLSCCERLRQWCCRACCCIVCCCKICCPCCINNKVGDGPKSLVSAFYNQEAERKVLITIEYIHYSNINTPSHVQVLAPFDQATFYQNQLKVDSLSFYLIDNLEFKQSDFDSKRNQAATLCRLVAQLKSMAGHYPDGDTLKSMIGQEVKLAVGEPMEENLPIAFHPKTITTNETVATLTVQPKQDPPLENSDDET